MKKLIITVFLVVLSASNFLPERVLYAKEFSSSIIKNLQKNESLYSAQILATNNYAFVTKNVAMYDNPARTRSNFYRLYHNNDLLDSYGEVAYYNLYKNGSITTITRQDYISKPMWFIKNSKSTNALIFDEIELLEKSQSGTRTLAFMRLDGLGHILDITDGNITELGTYTSLVDSVISDNGQKFAFVVLKEDGMFYLVENSSTSEATNEHLIESGSISSLTLTQDGKRLVYKKYENGQYFLVNGENIAGPYKEINNIVFSANGNNLAYTFASLPITNIVQEIIETGAIVTNIVITTNYNTNTSVHNTTAFSNGNANNNSNNSTNNEQRTTRTPSQNTNRTQSGNLATNYNTNSQASTKTATNSSTSTTAASIPTTNKSSNTTTANKTAANNTTTANNSSAASTNTSSLSVTNGYINYLTDDEEPTDYSVSFIPNSTTIDTAYLYRNLLSILIAQEYSNNTDYTVTTNEVVMQTNLIEINEKETIIEQEGETLVLNGKILGVYDSITNVGFSQDSRSFLYFTKEDNLTYVTDNDNKSQGYNEITAYQYSDDGKVFSYSADNMLIVNSNLEEVGVNIYDIQFLNDNSVLYRKKVYDRFIIQTFNYESAAYNEIVSINFLKSNLENTNARDNFVFVGIRGNKYYVIDRGKIARGPYQYVSPTEKINSVFYSIASDGKNVLLLEY